MIEVLLLAIYYAAYVGVMSCLISESNIAAPIRNFFGWSLLFCPICLGFWIALPFLFWFGLWFYFAVVAFSNVWVLIILYVYEALDRANEDTNG